MALRGLVDREGELEELRSLIDRARAGGGRLALLEGPAGIGKTRLLAAGRELAEGYSLRVLRASGSELERDFPFGVVRQLFEPLLAVLPDEEREQAFDGAAAHARPLLLPERVSTSPAGDPDYATLHGLYWLTATLSARRPLYMAVDDLHWTDAPSLRFLAFLSRRIEDLPIGVCGALRPAEATEATPLVEELASAPGAHVIRPAPLTRAGALTVAWAELGCEPDPDFVEACLAVTGGSPFYLRSLLAEAMQRGIDPTAENAAQVSNLGAHGISRMVLRRLSRLSPGAPELAQAMCILGEGATLARATRLAGLETGIAAATALEQAAIVTPGEPLSFVHPIVRTSIYQAIPAAERGERHAEAARMLSAEGADLDEVGAQLVLTDSTDPWAVEQLRAAAARALPRGAPETAAVYLRCALPSLSEPEDRAELLHELAVAETLMRDPSAVEHLQEAHRLSQDPSRRARIAAHLVQVLVFLGQWDPAAALARSALEELDGRDRALELLLEVMWAGTSAYDPRLVADLEPRMGELRRAAEEGGSAGRALTLLLAALDMNRGERLDEVVSLVERGLDHGRFIAEEGLDSPVLAQGYMGLLGIDALDRAATAIDEAEALARARGSVIGFALASAHHGAIASRRGDLVTAESELRASLALIQEHGQLFALPTLLWWAADCIAERPGNEAFSELAETLVLPAGMGATLNGALVLEARGRSRLAAGDASGAIEPLTAAGELYHALRCRNPAYYPWRSALALARAVENRAEALRLARSELEDADRVDLPRARGVALRALGLIEGGEAGLRSLGEAAAVLERSPSRLEHARALVELGAALRRLNRRAEARESLRAGFELAARSGAVRLVDRARTELRATGARPRRETVSGVEALTPSERRVADMAAAGLSNPQIAQALFVTVKTVEGHLSGVYRKLGVRARTELGSVLDS